MDGYDATRAVRRHEEEAGGQRRTPIVAMTADVLPEDRDRCLAAGMDGHIPKPVREEALRRAVIDFVLAPRGLADGAGDAPPAREPEATAAAGSTPTLLARLVGEREDLLLAAELFGDEHARLLAQMKSAISRREGEALARAAHALKGVVLYFGADAAYGAARRLEDAGRAAAWDEIPALLRELEEELDQILAALAALSRGEKA